MNEIEETSTRLRMVFRQLLRKVDTLAEADAPTRSEHSVLAWLDENGAMTPSALSVAQKVRPQTMGQTLEALDRRRWIKRAPHPEDRRQILISLSLAGQKALVKGRALRQAWLVGELKKVSGAERKTLREALVILERILPNEAKAPSKS